MMRWLLTVALLLAGIVTADAQGCGARNPNCVVPTAPPGTSDSRAASTAFVQGAIGGGGTFIVNIANNDMTVGVNNFNPNAVGAGNQFNLAVGISAMAAGGAAGVTANTAFGQLAMIALDQSGSCCNVAVGHQALQHARNIQFVTAVGENAGQCFQSSSTTLVTGSVIIGHGAAGGDDFTPVACTGGSNTLVGGWTLQEGTTAANNVYVGTFAGQSVTTGSTNTCLGVFSCAGNNVLTPTTTPNSSSDNAAIGFNALQMVKSGNNVAIGSRALAALTTGSAQIAIGSQALFQEQTGTGSIAIGQQSQATSNGGSNNLSFGDSSLLRLTTGHDNSCFGNGSCLNITTGVANTIFGENALGNATLGNSNNACFGFDCLGSLTTGTSNMAFGTNAGFQLTTQSNVVILGGCQGSGFVSATVYLCDGAGGVVAHGTQTGWTFPALPASAGGGGLFVCVDSTGNLYKKATCP